MHSTQQLNTLMIITSTQAIPTLKAEAYQEMLVVADALSVGMAWVCVMCSHCGFRCWLLFMS